MMKKLTAAIVAITLAIILTGCFSAPPPSPSPTATPDPTATPTPTPTVSAETTPTPSPTETAQGFISDIADQAGAGGVPFDIYQKQALEDLNGDGTKEEITFQAGTSNSKMTINGTEYTIGLPDLGQVFAITDVDTGDKWKEIVFSEKYDASYGSDPEVKPTAYLHWWNGTKLILMGYVGDAGFDGNWRSGFKCKDHFDGNKLVAGYASSGHLTKIYYTAHFNPSGSERKLKEVNYAAKVLWTPNDLTLKAPVLLLPHAKQNYFDSAHSVLWDTVGGEYVSGRGARTVDGEAAFMAWTGDTVKIVGVFGPNYVKLKTADNKTGWIRVIENKVQGYYQVMHVTAEDIFDGLASAG